MSSFELRHSLIDQIYVLRKESGENPIFVDVVLDLFNYVEDHLSSDWYNVRERIKKGKMI